jgi:hypothetical protein
MKKNKLTKQQIELFDLYQQRTVEQRIECGFIRTYRPVLDDEEYRFFPSMKEYKKWCKTLPKFLGMSK